MKSHRFERAARVGIASALIALTGVAARPASAAGAAFDLGTVAHTYNFTFDCRGNDGSMVTMVGWVQVDDTGVVSAGRGFGGATGATGTPTIFDMTLDTGGVNEVGIEDATHGVYGMSLHFVSPQIGPIDLLIALHLDDPRGRAGKLAGRYTISPAPTLTVQGILSGEALSE